MTTAIVLRTLQIAAFVIAAATTPLSAQQLPAIDPQMRAAAKIVEELPPGAADALVDLLHDKDRNFIGDPIFLLAFAEQAIDRDPNTALAWYYFGQLRLRYDVARCRDPTSEAVLTVAPLTARKTAAFARDNPQATA